MSGSKTDVIWTVKGPLGILQSSPRDVLHPAREPCGSCTVSLALPSAKEQGGQGRGAALCNKSWSRFSVSSFVRCHLGRASFPEDKFLRVEQRPGHVFQRSPLVLRLIQQRRRPV